MSTSDRPELRVDPATPTVGTEPVHAYLLTGPGQTVVGAGHAPSARHDEPVASTVGQLRAAYAQYVVDPHTHDVSVRIRDAATDEVISEIPSAEVAALNKSLREYAEALALRHAAAQGKAGA